MASKSKSPNLSAVIATLNRQQANALVTYLNLKKYHWLTYGPLFRDVHLLFDDHATQVYEMIDELAERAIMLDGQPVADPARYLPIATVKPSDGPMSLETMVREAIATSERVIDEMHADAETAGKVNDIGTADLYTRLVQIHQKQRWFLLQLLRKKDGLVN